MERKNDMRKILQATEKNKYNIIQIYIQITNFTGTVLFKKLTVPQLNKKFHTYYEILRLITLFTTAYQWSLS
jgi:hypothetical protein